MARRDVKRGTSVREEARRTPRRIDPMGAQPQPADDDAVMRDLRQQVRTTTPLDPVEEKALLEKSSLGDPASLDRVVAANLGMVIRLAEAHHDSALSVPDLVMEGSIGLVEAARSFATSGEPDFAKFAARKGGEQMDSAIPAQAAAGRDAELLVAAASDYERTELLLARELRRAPNEREIAAGRPVCSTSRTWDG